MKTHTQGLWVVDKDSDSSFLIVTNSRTIAMSNQTEVEENGMSIEELNANGRLIAAAPELLEALEGFIHSVEHEGYSGRIAEAREQAIEAIKKATL